MYAVFPRMSGVEEIDPKVDAPEGTLCTQATPRFFTFCEVMVESMVARELA